MAHISKNVDITRYYDSAVKLYTHYYDKRNSFLIGYVTGVTLTGVAIFEYPKITPLCIIFIFISMLALFLDLYIHKRVMIAAAILKELESKIGFKFENYKGYPKNDVGIMSQILEARRNSTFSSRTGGRYFLTYGAGTIAISSSIYIVFFNMFLEDVSFQSLLRLLCFTILFIFYIFVLYRVILKSRSYEDIVLDIVKYHENDRLYNKYRKYGYINIFNIILFYTNYRFRKEILNILKKEEKNCLKNKREIKKELNEKIYKVCRIYSSLDMYRKRRCFYIIRYLIISIKNFLWLFVIIDISILMLVIPIIIYIKINI